MNISKERAIQLVRIYLGSSINVADFSLTVTDFIDGWPEGIYRFSEEPAWAIAAPHNEPHQWHVGGTRFIVISKLTGKILADQDIGE